MKKIVGVIMQKSAYKREKSATMCFRRRHNAKRRNNVFEKALERKQRRKNAFEKALER